MAYTTCKYDGAVARVGDERAAEARQVRPDLVRAPRQRLHAQQRERRPPAPVRRQHLASTQQAEICRVPASRAAVSSVPRLCACFQSLVPVV